MPPRARVLIVDDSRIFRAALEASLAGQEGIEVVGSVFSGQKALEFVQATPPDVVTLDLEMPGMNGLETLRAIQRFNATQAPAAGVGVIMVSAHTKRGADVTMQALRDGAFDFVAKPSGPRPDENLDQLRTQLLSKIHQFLLSRRRARGAEAGAEPAAPPRPPPVAPGRRRQWLRAVPRRTVRALVIAASTGGPKALETVLPGVRERTDLPILVVQHMPPQFTLSLAESLARQSGGAVIEAQDGDPVRARTTYIAPGGKHLVLRHDQGRLVTGVNEQPPENGCRPSADVLFRSAAAALRGDLVAVVLTGMRRDGTAGLGAVKRSGGYVVVQDEATSVVWGILSMELTRAAFDDLRRSIHRLCGIALTEDKEYLVRHRLEPVVRACGCRSFDEFRWKLAGDEAIQLQEAIIEAITTQETAFFRDRHPFDALRRQILPELVRSRRAATGTLRRSIRIWCAAAATGQEPYSLAILIHELASVPPPGGARPEEFSILATDVSANALAAATAAAYEQRQVDRGLTANQIHKYFERCGEHWVARPALRKLVEFRRVNLIQPFSGLGTFEVILCRNALIYFDDATRRRICDQFFAMLADGGWLLLGSAENLYGISDRFTSVRFGDTLVYRNPLRPSALISGHVPQNPRIFP